MKKEITVVGGGSSAHSLIPFLSKAGHSVNLLTRKPEKWSKNISVEYQTPEGDIIRKFEGVINEKSNSPSKVIPQADIIILCMPVSKYRVALDNISSALSKSKEVYIGTIYGQGGFNWMVNHIKQQYDLENIVTFAVGLLPWIARTKEYGQTGINYGPKSKNLVALSEKEKFKTFNDTFLNDICYNWFNTGKFKLVDNFISLTLSVDNQIIHPTRLYGLYKKYGGEWKSKISIPYFYKDYDRLSADLLESLDQDYTKIRNSLRGLYPNKDFTYMLDYLSLERFSYSSNSSNILESFKDSVTLKAIETPTIKSEDGKWIFDKEHRFFSDDIFYGLCIAKWLAEELDKNVSTIDQILIWAQGFLGVNIIEDGKLLRSSPDLRDGFNSGIPEVYNFDTVDECID